MIFCLYFSIYIFLFMFFYLCFPVLSVFYACFFFTFRSSNPSKRSLTIARSAIRKLPQNVIAES